MASWQRITEQPGQEIPSLFGWRQATSYLTSPPAPLKRGNEGRPGPGGQREGTRPSLTSKSRLCGSSPRESRQEISAFLFEDDSGAHQCFPKTHLDALPRGDFLISIKLVRQEMEYWVTNKQAQCILQSRLSSLLNRSFLPLHLSYLSECLLFQFSCSVMYDSFTTPWTIAF